MLRYSEYLKNPFHWLIGFVIVFSLFRSLTGDSIKNVVASDGRGYYAFLPALFIYNDGSFEKSHQAEKKYHVGENPQLYLYKNKNGKTYNKYFPGIAILQTPFFALAVFTSWIINKPITGYSDIFYFYFLVGSIFYSTVGILLLKKCLGILLPNHLPRLNWFIPLLIISTPLLYYLINTPNYTHHYSFFLFGLFTLSVLQLKQKITAKQLFVTGLVLGLTVLVRPTNGVILLMVPFILGDINSVKTLANSLYVQARLLIPFLLGFCFFLSIIFFVWKWETGDWIVWSYNGEGFNFLHPQFFSCLFSFRIGLFVHTPVLLLSLLGGYFWMKNNKFRGVLWIIYFIVNCWIFSSWWCWDFLSNYGNRPYTEHLFYLLIPLFYLFERFPKTIKISLILFAIIGGVRYYSITNNVMDVQRFTKENYFESLLFWKKENKGRWQFTKASPPFGSKIKEIVLCNDTNQNEINPSDEFSLTSLAVLPKPRTNERIYYQIELEKKNTEKRTEGIILVLDAYTKNDKKRYYKAIELYNDRLEGFGNWVKIEFSDQIYDNFQEFDELKVYIWNQGKKHFFIKNMKVVVSLYKAN